MKVSKGKVALLVLAAAAYFGWAELSKTADDTVVLHIPPTSRSQDTYVSIWAVEDAQGFWIRAERPTRLWLPYLEGAPVVELTRGDDTQRYRAIIDHDAGTRSYVDRLFRSKYGLADQARSVLQSTTVPIRLVRP